MTIRFLLPLILIACSALPASAEKIPPSFDLESLSPAAGWQTTKKITVTGQFTDDRGFRAVQYRLRGRGPWKDASFVTEGTVASGTITANFTFNVTLNREYYTRVEIRAIDVDGVDSDHIGRRYRWDRYGFVVRDDTGTNTGTDTGTNTGNGGTNTPTTGGGTGGRDNGSSDGGNTPTDSSGLLSATPDQVSFLQFFGITAPPTIELAWDIPGATSVEIDNGVGAVPNTGTRSITSPTTTTTYTLTALVNGQTVTSAALVTVEISG